MKKDIKNKGEIALFVMFIILFFMLFVGLFISRMILKQTLVANSVANSVQSYYVADTGSEITLYKIRNTYSGPLTFGTTIPADDIFSDIDADYTATITSQSDESLRIEVFGVFKNTARAIELSWGNL